MRDCISGCLRSSTLALPKNTKRELTSLGNNCSKVKTKNCKQSLLNAGRAGNSCQNVLALSKAL